MKHWFLSARRTILPVFISVFALATGGFEALAQAEQKFVTVAAGYYAIGGKGHHLNPLREVWTDSFSIAATELTNQAFAQFVEATHYRTDAERLRNALVFTPGLEEFKWLEDSTANWRYPNGIIRGGINSKMNHPVTSISYADIQAYCKWAGVRLPSFEEWEIASRAGAATPYFWGNTDTAIERYANIWQGHDHLIADSTDGYVYTAPVASFAPNVWGLYDMYGNVFEFCEGQLPTDDPAKMIAHARGGSWWCSRHSCNYFNSVDIGRVHPHASFSNQGFRVVQPK